MIKLFLLVSLFLKFNSREAQASSTHIDGLLKHLKSKHSSTATCHSDSDCMHAYFCKNEACVAKRSEGSMCLSGRNQECACGHCALNPVTWEHVCMSERNELDCLHDGVNRQNTCKSNHDCPKDYFCDHQDDNVCKSLQPSGRLCTHDDMCLCGKCVQTEFQLYPNRAPIIYSVCESCH